MTDARSSSSRTIPPGRTWTARRLQIIAQISELIGTDLSEVFRYPTVGAALRWHTRYARQNGVHFSPTFTGEPRRQLQHVERTADRGLGEGAGAFFIYQSLRLMGGHSSRTPDPREGRPPFRLGQDAGSSASLRSPPEDDASKEAGPLTQLTAFSSFHSG